jgi:hypothetical protein
MQINFWSENLLGRPCRRWEGNIKVDLINWVEGCELD